MKFVCDNCSTQYLISDDKVGDRGVKVRCKRCGNVIIVRSASSEDQRATDPGGRRDELSDSDSPFDDQQGTEDRDEVGQAFDQLLHGGLGDEEDDVGEDRATELFRMDELQRQHGDRQGVDRDKIDQVFAGAESTELKRDPEAAGRGRSDWYVAIGDEQVGPMGMPELESRWAAGEIDAETLAWFPGMADWTPIGQVGQLKHLLGSHPGGQRELTDVDAPAPASPTDQPAEPGEEDHWAPYRGSELSSLVEEEMAASSPPPPEQQEPVDEQPLGLAADDEEIPPWEQDEPASGEVAKPADSFFDSTLDKPVGEEGGGYFNDTYSRSGRVLAGPAYLGGTKKNNSKSRWILIGVLGVVILGGGTVAAIVVGGGEEPAPAQTEPLKPPAPPAAGPDKAGPDKAGPGADHKGDESPRSAEGPKAKDEKADEKPQADAGEKQPAEHRDSEEAKDQVVVAKPPRAERPASDRSAERGSDNKPANRRRRRRTHVASAGNPGRQADRPPSKSPGSSSSPAPAADSNLPQKLSKAQISGTMKKYIKAMKGCVEQQHQRDPSVTGTMNVSFTIEPSGKVSTVVVKTAEHKGTYVAGCISFIIKSMKFPPARQSFTVPVLPLRLGG